jgi:4-amino-4-deoxy-L-arabinose transferase-like glycosyltransferase
MTMNGTSLAQLRAALNRWRLAFGAVALAYLIILLVEMTQHPIQWDEVIHLSAGSYLYFGNYGAFVGNAFYPPLFDGVIFLSFKTLGVSLFAARAVPVLFSVLSLWLVFELAYSMYDGKTALLSAVVLAVMPGYFWLSQGALLETALVFFVVASLLFFYRWLTTRKDKMLVFTGIALGLGFLTKYQVIVAGVILLVSILFLARNQLKTAFKKFTITIAAAVLVVVPWIVIAYQMYASQFLSQWVYALQVGNPERSIYSDRFPQPIFYLIDMVWPYANTHPISLFIYTAGLTGLVYLAWRHKPQDRYVVIWFVVIYVFFTLISNRAWRYALPVFPAVAISASLAFWALFGKLEGAYRKVGAASRRRMLTKVAAVLLVIGMAGAVAYSIYDTITLETRENINIELDQATAYALANISANKSIMVLAPFDYMSKEMVTFYLWTHDNTATPVYQYPAKAVDAYTPNFNITELTIQCRQNNVQYLFTYEYGGTVPYFNTTLNLQQIYMHLYASGNFTQIAEKATFGQNPRRIFILEFIG